MDVLTTEDFHLEVVTEHRGLKVAYFLRISEVLTTEEEHRRSRRFNEKLCFMQHTKTCL